MSYALCTLCYGKLPPNKPAEEFKLNEQTTLTLCSSCSDQATQIQTNTNSSREAAIAYMIDILFRALTSTSQSSKVTMN